MAQFDACVRRRGEATAVFVDDVPSARYLAVRPYRQGRAQEGLGLSTQAAENYSQFPDAATGSGDPLVRDARARVKTLASK